MTGMNFRSVQGTSECRVCVTIECPDGSVKFQWWRGTSARAIHKAAKKLYGAKCVQFGYAIYLNSYGAH